MIDAIERQIASCEQRLLQQMEILQPPERRDQDVRAHPNPAKERSIRTRGDQQARTTLWRLAGVDLTRIDGIGVGAVKVILTEIGTSPNAFPGEDHFVSWLHLCPRTPISGGKPLKKRRNALGANRVAEVLRMAAITLRRSKSALGAEYRRIARRKSAAIAVFVVARKLAQLVYRMLRYGQDYVDIGEAAHEDRFRVRRLAALSDSAKSLGYTLVQNQELPTNG
jgi:transposase